MLAARMAKHCDDPRSREALLAHPEVTPDALQALYGYSAAALEPSAPPPPASAPPAPSRPAPTVTDTRWLPEEVGRDSRGRPVVTAVPLPDHAASIAGPAADSAAVAPVPPQLPRGLVAGAHHSPPKGYVPVAAGVAVGFVFAGPVGSAVGGLIGHLASKSQHGAEQDRHSAQLPATDDAGAPAVTVRLWCAGTDAPLTELGWQLVRTDSRQSQMARFMDRVVHSMGGRITHKHKFRKYLLSRCRAGRPGLFSFITGRPFQDLQAAVAELGSNPRTFGVCFANHGRW